jgi:hypothetical protein
MGSPSSTARPFQTSLELIETPAEVATSMFRSTARMAYRENSCQPGREVKVGSPDSADLLESSVGQSEIEMAGGLSP